MAPTYCIPAADRHLALRRAGLAFLLLLALSPAVYRLSQGFSQKEQPGEVVLRYMAWGNPQQLDVERRIVAMFNERCRQQGQNVRVELFMPPAGGYGQKLRLMLASGTAPDVIRVDHYDFPSLVIKGYFRDLTDMAAADPAFDAGDFHESPMRENYYNGRLYGVNVLFGSVICYYNKDLFAQAVLEDPYELWKKGQWTWEKFEEAAERLTIQRNGRTVQYGLLLPGGGGSTPSWSWFMWAWAEDGDLLAPDCRTSRLGTPQMIAAMQRYRDLRYKLKVAPTPADSAASAFTFESGSVGMIFEWSGMSPRYRDNIRDFSWDIAPTPSPAGRPTNMVKGNQLVMTTTCKHPRAAWEWMKFMVSPEVELILHGDALRRCVPTRKSILRPPPGTPPERNYLYATKPPFQTDVFPYALDHSRELPIDATWPVWTTRAQKYIDKLFIDENADVATVLRAAQADVDQVLAEEHQRLKRYAPGE